MEHEFRFFNLGAAARFVLAAGLYGLGAFIELAFPSAAFLGYVIAALGWAPLALSAATNKPKDQGLEEWRLVSMAEVDGLEDSLRRSLKLRKKVGSPSLVLPLVVAMPAFVILFFVAQGMGRADLVFVALNAVVYLVPAYFFGHVRVFVPQELSLKMPCFRAVLAEPPREDVAIAPYIRFDKDDKGLDVPEDLRLLLELKRPPVDFVGIQLQAAINKGPNGDVPYLYAVVLTKGKKGPSYATAKKLRRAGYEVEAGGDDSYGSVVIRQDTDDGGYCTTPDDCASLLAVCNDVLSALGAA
jgi:hypothetical protein